MKQLQTRGIILNRTNYGEADRILTVLTPDHGKLSLMARGARRQKSKLAGGIELFSVSDMSFMPGRGDIGTLISTRLIKQYSHIVTDMERVRVGYDLLKLLHRVTEDRLEPAYFSLLERALAALDNHAIDLDLIRIWFCAQLLRLAGYQPNLRTTAKGQELEAGKLYSFDFDDVNFVSADSGSYDTNIIKFLRLLFSDVMPGQLARVQENERLVTAAQPFIQTMASTYLRIEKV